MNNTSAPPAWKRLKLQMRWIVFEDQFGNFIMIEPNRPKAMGMDEKIERPPTICIAATEDDYYAAMESILWDFQRVTRVDARHRELVERVEEARGRHKGWPRAVEPAEDAQEAA